MSQLVGGIEAGGTKFVCAVGTGPDDVRALERFATTTPAETIARAIEFFKGESSGPLSAVGIASFDDDHIHRLASMAPVSRIMVRQPNVRGNAGSFTNGMPQTASLGCGTWGGNITSENLSVKHYMNTTWVSRPIPEDKPNEQDLLGEFYNSETFDPAPAVPA